MGERKKEHAAAAKEESKGREEREREEQMSDEKAFPGRGEEIFHLAMPYLGFWLQYNRPGRGTRTYDLGTLGQSLSGLP